MISVPQRTTFALLVAPVLIALIGTTGCIKSDGDSTIIKLSSNVQSWRFQTGDDLSFATPRFDDSGWEEIQFPHSALGAEHPRGWYRLRFTLPDAWSNKPLMLRLGPIDDVDETYLNGERIGGMGEFGPGLNVGEHAYDRIRLYPVPTGLPRFGPENENVLAVRVQASFEYSGGFGEGRSSAYIGEAGQIQRYFYREQLLDFAVVLIAMTVGAYFLLLFLRTPTAYDYLAFAAISLTLGAYIFLRTQLKYEISEDFLVLKKAEYVAVFCLMPFYLNFVYLHLGKRAPVERWFLVSYNTIIAIAVAIVLATDSPATWDLVNRFASLPGSAITILFLLVFLIRRVVARVKDAIPILIGGVLILLGYANDTLQLFGLVPWGAAAQYAFLGMVLLVALMLANRMVALQERVERNAADMGQLYAGSRLILEGHDLQDVLRALLGGLPFGLSIVYEFDSQAGTNAELGRFVSNDKDLRFPTALGQSEYSTPDDVMDAVRNHPHLALDIFALEKENEMIGVLVGVRGKQPLDRDTREHVASTLNLLSLLISSRNLQHQLLNQERLSALGGAASAIVHDLKGPLHIIQGYATYMAETDCTHEDRKQYLGEIQAEIEEMDSMTREILEYSRDEIVLKRERKNIGKFLEELVKEFRNASHNGSITLSVPDDDSPSMNLDYSRLRRAILNLLNNAVDAVADAADGKVEIGYESDNAQKLRLFIRDNGPGIPEEIRSKLFDPFVTSGKSAGTGLGTAIAKKITEAHGGRIWFETEAANGTAFYLELGPVNR